MGKNQKGLGIVKDDLGEIIMKKFVGLTAKIYLYLTDDDKKEEKGQGTNKCTIAVRLMFDDYKN